MRGLGNLGQLIGGDCAGQEMTKASIAASQYIPPSYVEQLKQARDVLQARVDNYNKLIEKLETNPDFVELIDLANRI